MRQRTHHVDVASGEVHTELAHLLSEDMRWLSEEALCAQVDTELFFPKKGGSVREAKRVCRACPLIADCLDYALNHPVFGVWGGTSQVDRRVMGARVA